MQVKDANRNRRTILTYGIACLVLELAIAPNVGIASGRANFALVFSAIMALTVGGRTGVLCGFFAGLLFDLSTTGPVGLMALLLTVASYVMGVEERNRLVDDTTESVIIFAICDVAVALVYNVTMFLMGQSSSVVDLLFLRAVPTAFLTAVAYVPFVYIALRRATGPRTGGLGASKGGRHAASRYNIGKM